MIVIALASWRVSRLNIVRAIRDIPEPLARRGTRLQWLLAAVSLSLGIVATWQANRSQIPVLSVLGPSLLAYCMAGRTPTGGWWRAQGAPPGPARSRACGAP